MVGLLSGMDNEDLSSDKDVNVCDTPAEQPIAQKQSPEESQPAAEKTDNTDEGEQVKELKSILKRRGQYTFRKVKVDFDLIPKKIPYNEDDYTVEIKIVEKEPVKIKSWAAIFAAKKAEAEAEAAAEAEAQEALKKAEEVQKREAMKKANKAKMKKVEVDEQSKASGETDGSLSTKLSSQRSSPMLHRKWGHAELDPSQQSGDETLSRDISEQQDLENKWNNEETSGVNPAGVAQTPESDERSGLESDYQQAESIVTQVVDRVIIQEDLLSLARIPEERDPVRKHEDEISGAESLDAERSENLEEEHTNEDLEDISTQEEASMSQLAEDSESVSQEISRNQLTSSDTKEKLSDDACHSEDLSSTEYHSEDISTTASHSGESSSISVELQGKKVPKKVLVTASSLVEEILSEVPVVIPAEMKDSDNYSESSIEPTNENRPARRNTVENEETLTNCDITNTNANLESDAHRKRKEFKRSNDSKIFEHIKRSLENAAPDILETAVGVLDEIEKIVIDKVGPPIA